MNKLLGVLLLSVGVAQAGTLSVTWSAPTQSVDGSALSGPVTYQLYAGAKGAEIKLGNPVTSGPYVINPAPTPGTTECVQVSAIAGGLEGPRSPELCVTIPQSAPSPPLNVKCTFSVIPAGSTSATITANCQ